MKRIHLKNLKPLPEIDADDLPCAVQKLWVCGHSDYECRKILGLTQAEFLEIVSVLRTVNTSPQTAQEEFEEYAYTFDKFRIMCEAKIKKLNEILEPLVKSDPIHGCAVAPGSARRIIKQMSALDQAVFDGQTQLLLLKVRLGLVQKPQRQPEYLPGGQLPDDALFKSSTVKQAWAQRLLLSNANNSTRN